MHARSVAVCIPARNEADRLPALVRSLAAQRLATVARPLRVVVVANNCTDATVPVLESLQHAHDDAGIAIDIVEVRLEPAQAHVGFARRLAMDWGAAWLDQDGVEDGVLMTTDADAMAPPDWVAANLAALGSADVVGGRLRMATEAEGDDRVNPLHARIERYWEGVRALEQAIDPPAHDPDPRHGDHTAASLALSVALYRQVGGLPTLACGEDNALVARVRHIGGRVRHCPHVGITVSPRRAGRVEGGMASEMARRAMLTDAGHAYHLPAADHWRALFERRAALRQAWTLFATGARDEAVFGPLGLSGEDLAVIAPAACPNDIAFVERAMLRESQRMATPAEVELGAAVAELDDLRHRFAGMAGRASG